MFWYTIRFLLYSLNMQKFKHGRLHYSSGVLVSYLISKRLIIYSCYNNLWVLCNFIIKISIHVRELSLDLEFGWLFVFMTHLIVSYYTSQIGIDRLENVYDYTYTRLNVLIIWLRLFASHYTNILIFKLKVSSFIRIFYFYFSSIRMKYHRSKSRYLLGRIFPSKSFLEAVTNVLKRFIRLFYLFFPRWIKFSFLENVALFYSFHYT